jgi:hypothetical protein
VFLIVNEEKLQQVLKNMIGNIPLTPRKRMEIEKMILIRKRKKKRRKRKKN